MTTEPLEREIRALADRRPEDEQLRLALRATLGTRLAAPPARRRRRLLLGSAALTAAAVAAAVIAFVVTGGTGGVGAANAAILAHVARASTPPPGLIVHVDEVGVQPDGTRVGAEWWQETDAPYAHRLIKGTAAHQEETASDGTTASEYDPATNTVYQQPDSTPPALIDPIESVRPGLAAGTAQVQGTATIDGRPYYEIVLPNGVVGYFDEQDYRPAYLDNPQHGGGVVRTRVVAYDELPVTPENEQLLRVAAQHPGAKVMTGPAPDGSGTK